MKSGNTFKKMIKKADDKILDKKTMIFFGSVFLALTIISGIFLINSREGLCLFPTLICGLLAFLAFMTVKDSVNPNYPEWPDPPKPEP